MSGQGGQAVRDPVTPAECSAGARRKAQTRRLDNGDKIQSFRTLLRSLSAIVRNTCRAPAAGREAPTFEVATTLTAAQ